MCITTGVNDTVIALDARTGTAKWKFQPKLGFTTFCCGSNNRVSWWTMEGIRGHARRIAVRARRRHRRRRVANDGRGAEGWIQRDDGLRMPGTAWCFIGSAGGEYGIRVSVTAYSQADGKQVWRWWATNPGQGVLREP